MIDILWLLICSTLVFVMQAGFMCLESGLTRTKNSINVAVKNLADFGVSVAIFWAFGYAIMFGLSIGGFIGNNNFFLNLDESKIAAFFLFQAMFCGTSTTIISGAIAERMKFGAYLIVAIIVASVIYPFIGHWIWNGVNLGIATGWLRKLGFVDFAGGTVVHSVGAWVSLATLTIIGSRKDRFPKNQPPNKIHGSNLSLSVLGTIILWFGWFGFNGGSIFSLNEQVPLILGNTVIAGVGGMLSTVIISWKKNKFPKVEALINGSLAGLVSITACCHVVTTPLAFIVGAVGGAVMLIVSYSLEHFRIDDAVDAIAVHGGGGVWGTLSVALFGNIELINTGLNRYSQLGIQILGIFTSFLWAFLISWLILSTINRFFPLRVSIEEEIIGLNISEHQAQTLIFDVLTVMNKQKQTQNLSLRVPEEAFTEIGLIAKIYNQVMDALETSINRTEAILNTAIDAIITFNSPQLEIISANPSVEGIFGYNPQSIKGMNIKKILPFLDEKFNGEKITLEHLLDENIHELLGYHANGSSFPLEATFKKVDLGKNSFYTATLRNIYERKLAEDKLKQYQIQLQSQNQKLQDTLRELQETQTQMIHSEKMSSLGQMVGGIAHEINNPVSFIHGNIHHLEEYTENLLELIDLYEQNYPDSSPEIVEEIEEIELDFIKKDMPKMIKSIRLGTTRIRDIVKSLRTFSRLDEEDFKQVDIHEGIDSTLIILQNRIKAKIDRPKINIIKNYGELPLVRCLPGQLNQVVMNILANGIDALEESLKNKKITNPTLTITTEITKNNSQEEEFLTIKIEDNAMGIPQDILSKLFDPFFTTKPIGKGTGLGLAISHSIIVEKHYGILNCVSELGKGAEFIISIPII